MSLGARDPAAIPSYFVGSPRVLQDAINPGEGAGLRREWLGPTHNRSGRDVSRPEAAHGAITQRVNAAAHPLLQPENLPNVNGRCEREKRRLYGLFIGVVE